MSRLGLFVGGRDLDAGNPQVWTAKAARGVLVGGALEIAAEQREQQDRQLSA
jgi:hypothetical protein